MSERTDDATPVEHNGITAVVNEQVDGGDGALIGHSDDAGAAESGDEASSSDERIEDLGQAGVPGSDDSATLSSSGDVTAGANVAESGDESASSGRDEVIDDAADASALSSAGSAVDSSGDAARDAAVSSAPGADARSTRIVDADSSGAVESSISAQVVPGIGDGDGIAGGSSEMPLGGGGGEEPAASAGAAKTAAGKTARAGKTKKDADAGSDDEVAEFTPEPLDDDEFRSALEAMLLIVDAPAPVELLADALQDKPVRVERALHEMAAELSARASGIDLRFVGDGWRFYTRSEYAPYVERMLLDGARSKLTRAALETLAVVAYRQPVTRTRVSAVRGVNVDGVMRTLLARGLIAEAGVDPETNGTQYCTTELFLERIGLASLSDLPPLAPLLPGVDLIDEINESLDTDPRYTRLKKSAETNLDLGTEED